MEVNRAEPTGAMGRGVRTRFTQMDAGTRPMEEEVLEGLRKTPKAIPPKYLYDVEGSRLFDLICELPAYYLTRAETSILERHAAAMLERLGSRLCIIEPGAGACAKVRTLLATGRVSSFVPLDISAEYLRDRAADIARTFPGVSVHAVAMDFMEGLDPIKPIMPPAGRRLILFPGSSIGNLDPSEAVRLLTRFHDFLDEGDCLLIGYDLRKDGGVLSRAYDDPEGVTASFNLNLLARLNRELSADFDLAKFRHVAVCNEGLGRVEMYLESLAAQRVTVANEAVFFDALERLHTENSYKYTVEGFAEMAGRAGFRALDVWKDGASYFAVGLYVKDGAHRPSVPRNGGGT